MQSVLLQKSYSLNKFARQNDIGSHHLLTRGEIKSAKKLGSVASRASLLRELGASS